MACLDFPPRRYDRPGSPAEQALDDRPRFRSDRAVLRIFAQLAATTVKLAERVMRPLRNASRPSGVAGGFASDLTRSRSELIAENAFLRQQLIVASRAVKRPAFRGRERGLLVLLARILPRWRCALLLVKPETVLRWHRAGFRLFWRNKSRSAGSREPRMAPNVIALIRCMAIENRLWGAERIRGELLKLGIRVAKRTVQRYMRGARPPSPHPGQSWATFLRNHTVWACDFLQTYDIWFRPVFAFFIIDVNARCVVHLAVTRTPTRQWTPQQLRNATPFGQGPRFLIRDRDEKFGPVFDRVAKRRDARRAHCGSGTAHELRVRAISRERATRVPRSPGHALRAAPAPGARRIRAELLQRGPAPPGDRTTDSGSG
jgi:hypothetical protein